MKEIRKICEGVYKHEGNDRPVTTMIDGREFHRFMDFFYIDVEADELLPEQVNSVCRERAIDPRSFAGANQKAKEVFKEILRNSSGEIVLEIGAGERPILSPEEAREFAVKYITSDADSAYSTCEEVFSGSQSRLRFHNEFFDKAIALFVLHFRFYPEQIGEIYRCLKDDGLFFANVYRRSAHSRTSLIEDFCAAGFKVILIDDPRMICSNHQYLLAAKTQEHLNRHHNHIGPALSLGV